jgi:glutathione synthase
MKIAFFVNNVATEKATYTTTRLAMEAANRGHLVWYIGAGDFTYEIDETVRAWARPVPPKKYRSATTFINSVNAESNKPERITVDEIDVLMLRNDPALETGYRSWAKTAGIIFGRVAMRNGVIVLNDPDGLGEAMDKMFVQQLPESVRPRSIITRSRSDVKAFVTEVGGKAVLKGMQGTGDQSIFLVTPNNRANLNQMIETITRDDYVIAQEYLPEAERGGTRLFLVNGEPLRYKGKIAAFQWVRSEEDMRSNVHFSGTVAAAKLTDVHFQIAEAVRPRLVQDGLFLAGLHVVGNKLLDINVFSPGGLGNAQRFEKVNFGDAVINALEKKVDYMVHYHRNFNNVDMATL